MIFILSVAPVHAGSLDSFFTGGDKWPLDLGIFKEYTQQNEFNNTRGDASNPICLAKNEVCGEGKGSQEGEDGMPAEGPNGVCCEHLKCTGGTGAKAFVCQ